MLGLDGSPNTNTYLIHIHGDRGFFLGKFVLALVKIQKMSNFRSSMSRDVVWAELWLANTIFYTVWVKIQLLEKNVDTVRFWVIFQKNPRIVGKASAQPVGVLSMHPRPPKCNIRQTKNKYVNNKIKNSLELRLDIQWNAPKVYFPTFWLRPQAESSVSHWEFR